LAWIIERLEDLADAVETPIGRVPAPGSLDVSGMDISADVMAELFAVDSDSWLAEADLTAEYFELFGDRLPTELVGQLDSLKSRLQG
jgi:phosphoenolpyruvate carboxykinase (GTP)